MMNKLKQAVLNSRTLPQKAAPSQQPEPEFDIKADIGYDPTRQIVAVIYNQQVGNTIYTLPQLEGHIRGLLLTARKLDPEFMKGCAP